MLTRYIIFCFLLFPLTTFCQIGMINSSLVDSSRNVLYRGIENKIVITGITNYDSIKFHSLNGEIVHWEKSNIVPSTFLLKIGTKVHDTLSFDRISIIKLHDTLYTKTFKVDKIGEPLLQLGQIQDSLVSIDEMVENKKLNVVIENCFYDHQFKVFSFHFTIKPKSGKKEINFQETKGNLLLNRHIRKIKRLKKDDELIFSQVLAHGADCAGHTLPPLVLKIK
jgi:hypothetical protein